MVQLKKALAQSEAEKAALAAEKAAEKARADSAEARAEEEKKHKLCAWFSCMSFAAVSCALLCRRWVLASLFPHDAVCTVSEGRVELPEHRQDAGQ